MSQFALPLSTLQTMQVVIRPDRFLDLGCDFEPNPEAPLVMQGWLRRLFPLASLY